MCIPSCEEHYARYTPELVERFPAFPRAVPENCGDVCSASGPEKTGAICYALGWTQQSKAHNHSCGCDPSDASRQHRTAWRSILALRGHASIQGSTDIPTLTTFCLATCDAESRLNSRNLRITLQYIAIRRLVVELRQVHRQSAQGLLREERKKKTIGIQLAPACDR